MVVVESLLPVFLIIGLGAALAAAGKLGADMLKGFNWLAYWVGLPCLLFASVSQTEDITGRPLHIFGVLLAATLVTGGVAWLAARILGLPRTVIGTFVQGAFRGNLTLLGLPVAIFAFGPEIVPVVALAIAPMMILYNIFAAFVLLASQEGADRTSKRAFVRQLMLNPLVLSILAGLVAGQSGLVLPGFLNSTIRSLAAVAIPIALLGIGGTLVLHPVRTQAIPAVTGSLIKVVLTPVLGVLLARLVGMGAEDVRILGILLGSPTAAASFVMAAQMKGDAALASSMVVTSTLISAASLSVVLLVL